MYLRVSDQVGGYWTQAMTDVRGDSTGNWCYHVVGKGNQVAQFSIRDNCIRA
ncbi:hypothetical protein D3C84_1222380 [compost metagenome]